MRVLIVDDSVVFRSAIKTALMSAGIVSEIDIASNGKIAVEKLQQSKFDGVTLDLEMPVMDGIQTIQEIRKFDSNIPIIIFSAQNLNAANKTIKALEIGADDFVQKLQNSTDVNENLKLIQQELVPRFKALIEKKTKKTIEIVKKKTTGEFHFKNFKADLVCIGSSTGGPDFLLKIFSKIKMLNVPILIIQHMPPIFTTQLAKTLNDISPNSASEAKVGDVLKPGHIYIAPGDYHMRIKKSDNGYIISLDQGEKVCFVRPAVDVTFDSVASQFEGNIAAYIFTGMGNDGADGCEKLRKKNTLVSIQDEESSVVWGMPRAVYDRNLYDDLLTPEEIIQSINTIGT